MRRTTLIALLALAVAGCSSPVVDDAKPSVAVSFYPLQFLAERIAGDDATVWSLLPPGAEPHDAEPLPADVARLERADLFVYHGAGLDPWAERLAFALPDGVAFLSATEGLTLLPPEEHDEEHAEGDEHHDDEGGHEDEQDHHDAEEGHEHGAFDPHVWFDADAMIAIADEIGAHIADIDPAHAEAYAARTAAVQEELRQLDQRYRQGLAECARRDIVTAHDAFGYLGRRYDLRVHAIAGLSPEEEPAPDRLAALSDEVQELGITTVFFEMLTSSDLAETLAREAGVQTAVLHTLEGLTQEEQDAGASFISLMDANLAALRGALDCR